MSVIALYRTPCNESFCAAYRLAVYNGRLRKSGEKQSRLDKHP